jgi:phospholipid/cholesterol/gamma-HCH transport system substrate-binding protein
MENRAYALMTGLFVVGLLAALLVAGWWLSDSSRDRVPYLVVSENSVAGLSPYATVRFRGVEVGQVTSIDFAGDGTGEIHVMLELDPDAPVTDRTMASMSSQGMMGRTVVDLEESAPGGERLHSSEDNPARIPLDGEMVNLEMAMARTAERLGELAERMAVLLDEDNRKALAGTLRNLEEATAVAPGLLAELEQTLPTLRKTLDGSNEALAGMNRVLVEIERLGQAGNSSTLPRLERLMDEWEKLARQLGDDPGAVLFAPVPRPGPGEPGYSPPKE